MILCCSVKTEFSLRRQHRSNQQVSFKIFSKMALGYLVLNFFVRDKFKFKFSKKLHYAI